MINRLGVLFFGLTTFFVFSTPSYAHHGTAINYDMSVQLKMTGVVTRFRYAQPHTQLFMDVEDENGNVVTWSCEYIPNIPTLIREGWTRKRMNGLMPKGKKVNVVYSPSRSGKPVALILRIEDAETGEVIGMAFDKPDINNPKGD